MSEPFQNPASDARPTDQQGAVFLHSPSPAEAARAGRSGVGAPDPSAPADSPASRSAIRWEDLPAKPWAPEVEPPAEQLAEWLTSLTRPHLAWVLEQQRGTWNQESRCFIENHVGHLAHLESRVRELRERLEAMTPAPVMPSSRKVGGDHDE